MSDWPAPWNEVWDLLARERAALLSILRAFQASGLKHTDAEEILNTFALEKLPRIVEHTRSWPDEARGQYLRASLRNFARSALRTLTREASGLERLRGELETSAAHAAPSTDFDEVALERALKLLPPNAERAVRAFLGLDGEAMSLREIGKHMGWSRYATTLTVLDGLLTVALSLGETGVLTPAEVEVCRRVLVAGESVAVAAEALGVSQGRIRAVLRRARSVVSAVVQ